jgi:hypothetical protein
MVGRDVRGFHLEDLGLGEGGWDYRESFWAQIPKEFPVVYVVPI